MQGTDAHGLSGTEAVQKRLELDSADVEDLLMKWGCLGCYAQDP